MPPHRRSPATRRSEAAGQQHPADATGQQPGIPHEPLVVGNPDFDVDNIAQPPRNIAQPPRRVIGVATLVGLSAVLVIALGLAAWFRGEVNQLSGSSAASNAALVDVGSTAQVSGQVRDALHRVFSYDFTRLDDDERAAADVITGSFVKDFQQQFARVREVAPAERAVVVATVPALAVRVLDGDRAIVVVFIDQQANRGAQAEQLLAASRLTVTAQRVNGSWKISDVQPF